MSRFASFLFAALFSVAVFTSAPPARASLSDALSDMLASTATNPGVYMSQRRGVLTGGSFQMRWPIRNIWLFHVAPPHLNAGCNGIDFFGGSFSFISAEQFKQILRQIGTAAVGYAFQLAIATICQECASLMAHLQDLMNNINSQQASSCAIGAKLVASVASKMDLNDAAKQELTKIEKDAGGAEGFFDALTKVFSDPGWGSDSSSYAVQSANATGSYGGAEKIGNITYRALYKDSAVNKLGSILSNYSSSANLFTIEVMISLVGTIVYPEDPNSPANQGGCNASPSDQKNSCVPTFYRKNFSLQNLMWAKNGTGTTAGANQDQHVIWRCVGSNQGIRACASMREGIYNEKTLDQIVHHELFGTYNMNDITGTSTSIVGRIQAGADLTPAQQNFINITRIPLYRMLVDVHKVPTAVSSIAAYVEKDFVRMMGARIGTTILLTVDSAFSADKDKPVMPPVVKEGMVALRQEVTNVTRHTELSPEKINQLVEYVKNIKGSFPEDHKPAGVVQ